MDLYGQGYEMKNGDYNAVRSLIISFRGFLKWLMGELGVFLLVFKNVQAQIDFLWIPDLDTPWILTPIFFHLYWLFLTDKKSLKSCQFSSYFVVEV